jgi:hypothetical protein
VGLDDDGIARVLMTPDETTPTGLVNDLCYVDRMSLPESMDDLLRLAAQSRD